MNILFFSVLLFVIEAPGDLAPVHPGGTEERSLELSGTPNVKILGVCFSKDGVTEKRFEGVTPTEVALEVGVQKCSLKSPAKKSRVKIRLFQNRKVLLNKDIPDLSSGVEIAIPFGK